MGSAGVCDVQRDKYAEDALNSAGDSTNVPGSARLRNLILVVDDERASITLASSLAADRADGMVAREKPCQGVRVNNASIAHFVCTPAALEAFSRRKSLSFTAHIGQLTATA